MSGYSFGIVEGPYGQWIITDALSAMYVRAHQAGDKELVKLLEHRAARHDGGPCHCEDRR